MKKTVTKLSKYAAALCLVCLLSSQLMAQQVPLLSHYYYNPYLINPALAGQAKETRAFLLYRHQWVGIPGSPQTQALTIDGPLSENSPLGLGMYVNNDENNIIGRLSAMFSSSYSVKLAESHELSFGMSLGLLHNEIKFDKIRADITDPGLLLNAENRTTLEGNAGLSYRFKKLRAGFATEQLFNRQVVYDNPADSRDIAFQLVRHYLLTLQYSFKLSENLQLEPLVLFRSAQGLAPQFDVNATLKFKDLAWTNIQYRDKAGVGVALGGQISDRFMIGYNYELPTSALQSATSGSHEVMIGMRFLNRGTKTPSSRSVNSRIVDDFKKENNAQYEKLDEIQQRNETLNQQLLEYKKIVDDQNSEIEKLKSSIRQVDAEMKTVIAGARVDLQSESNFDKAYTYYLVIGAVKTFSEAKDFEKIIKRETRLRPAIIQNEGKTWYFIYSNELKSAKEARDKMRDLEKDNIAHLIIGNPWVYKAIKEKE